ncbi:GGDEF domain-containing protein [Kordiimonas pumila]|uniref:diguanylate cyclase n=1 Tax=Kordiimonas pumila TaxID=2161677 RepID=A0ABV7D9F0_9PROT|nr:GGDEF domain-containing protein [Kordiimonas pumila]
MALDIPTLSIAVMLVMLLSSLALLVNWLANRVIDGLLYIAFGIILVSFGTCVSFENPLETEPLAYLAGQSVIILGHGILWLGVTDFWAMRSKRMMIALWLISVLSIGIMAYLMLFHDGGYVAAVRALFEGLVSFGIASTLLKAIGGRKGLYKGVIRRATVGAALAFLLFIVHGFYGFYRAMPLDFLQLTGNFFLNSIEILSYVEMVVFSMSIAVVIIIMTAERLQAELKLHEMLDPLTKALKQRAFLEVVKAVLARARRNAEPVSLIMMDIDRFKKINTEHGRAVGDAALAAFAGLVVEGRRAQDVFCRFGGEEFVLLLPGTAEEGADLVVRRIRQKIAHTALKPLGVPIQLTISMGVVTARGDDLDADGMLDFVNKQISNDQKLQFEIIQTGS